MSNPLYSAFQNPLLAQFAQFRQTFSGDPRQQVQQLLNSGRVTQAQYNAAVQQAQELVRIIGK